MKGPVNSEAILLENILIASEQLYLSEAKAKKIVGGKRLERLIDEGRIYAFKKSDSKNAKLFCRASDCFRHCKNFR